MRRFFESRFMNSADGLGRQTDSVIKNLPEIIHSVELHQWYLIFINDTIIVSYWLSFNPPLQVTALVIIYALWIFFWTLKLITPGSNYSSDTNQLSNLEKTTWFLLCLCSSVEGVHWGGAVKLSLFFTTDPFNPVDPYRSWGIWPKRFADTHIYKYPARRRVFLTKYNEV